MRIDQRRLEGISRSRLITAGFVIILILTSSVIAVSDDRLSHVSVFIWVMFWLSTIGSTFALGAWVASRLDPTLDSPGPSYISGLLSDDEAKVLLRYLHKDTRKHRIVFVVLTLISVGIAITIKLLSGRADVSGTATILLYLPLVFLELIYMWAFIYRPTRLSRILRTSEKHALIRLKVKGELKFAHNFKDHLLDLLEFPGFYFMVGQHIFQPIINEPDFRSILEQLENKHVEVEIAAVMPDIPLRISLNDRVIADQLNKDHH